jgi:hypothetical protein
MAKKSRVKHLVSGGTIGETHMACGKRMATEEMDAYFDLETGSSISTIYLDNATCKRCLRSAYARKHGRRRS